MPISPFDLADLNRLLKEGLDLPAAGRDSWLPALPQSALPESLAGVLAGAQSVVGWLHRGHSFAIAPAGCPSSFF